MNREVERRILWAAVEDYTGLWEIVWDRANLPPQSTPDDRKRLAQSVLRKFIARDWIRLYREETVGGGVQPISSEEFEAEILRASNWDEPQGPTPTIRIGATSKGEAAY